MVQRSTAHVKRRWGALAPFRLKATRQTRQRLTPGEVAESGLSRSPRKRVITVNVIRGFESRPLRHHMISGSVGAAGRCVSDASAPHKPTGGISITNAYACSMEREERVYRIKCPRCGVTDETCQFYEHMACYTHPRVTGEDTACHICGHIADIEDFREYSEY